MPVPHSRVAVLLVVLASLVVAAPVAARFEVLETRDLRLIYPRLTMSFLAPHTARCFENSMRFYRERMAYVPSEKVNVILDDSADYGNAAVWVSPRNSMLVYIAPANFVYETGPANERINFAMNHEVAHIVTLDQAVGVDRWVRRAFFGKVRETAKHPETMLYGYLSLPRRAAPRWHREGTAVFFETWMAGGIGRAQGPWDEMVFRSMVRDDTPFYDPLGLESEGTKTDFQIGVNSYLYGTRFTTWLVHEHGPEPLLRWVSRATGSRAYFATQFRKVYGRSLTAAWREWVAWERDFQRANLDSIRRHPVTEHRDLSSRALGSVSRAHLDRATRTLYAAVYYPGTVAHIAALPLDGGAARMVREVKGPALYFVSSLAWDEEGRRLFYTADNNQWRDLCELDPATGRSRTLIRDARIGDLAFNRADRSLWAVRHLNGHSTLVRLEEPYREWRRLHTFPYGRDLYDIDVSPDGRWLAASVAEISGRQSLRLWPTAALAAGDSAGRTLFEFGASIPTSFVFSPDGRYLYGSSYYTGVSNIFRYDLAADSMDIVTNAETGFFRPLPVADDSLVVFRYTGEGFVPAMIEARPLTDVGAITFLGQQTIERHPELDSWNVGSPARIDLDSVIVRSAAPYRPLAELRLDSAYPIVQGYRRGIAVGAHVSLSDPLLQHAVELAVTRGGGPGTGDDERWHATLEYRRRGLSARAFLNPADFYDLFGPTRRSRRGRGGSLSYERALLRDPPRTLEIAAGVSGFTGLRRHPVYQNVPTSPGFSQLMQAGAEITGKNLRSSIGAAEHELGHEWSVAAGVNSVRFEFPDRDFWRGFPQFSGTAEVGSPLPLRNSSLWLRGAAGWSPGDRHEPFANFYFGGFGNNWVDHREPKRYREATSFPGLELNELGGTNYARGLVDWNLPPLRFRRLGTVGFYASWARLSVFGAGLVTNLDSDAARQRAASIGAQADIRLQLLTQQRLTLSFGLARGFRPRAPARDEWMGSLKIL